MRLSSGSYPVNPGEPTLFPFVDLKLLPSCNFPVHPKGIELRGHDRNDVCAQLPRSWLTLTFHHAISLFSLSPSRSGIANAIQSSISYWHAIPRFENKGEDMRRELGRKTSCGMVLGLLVPWHQLQHQVQTRSQFLGLSSNGLGQLGSWKVGLDIESTSNEP